MISIPGVHIKLFNDDEWEAAKAGLAAAGKAEVASFKSNTAKFLATLEAKFPEVYEDIKKGVHDLKDDSMKGGEKAVKVAGDVMASIPDVLAAIPGIKDALVAGVTQFFADEVSDFKDGVEQALEALAKAI